MQLRRPLLLHTLSGPYLSKQIEFSLLVLSSSRRNLSCGTEWTTLYLCLNMPCDTTGSQFQISWAFKLPVLRKEPVLHVLVSTEDVVVMIHLGSRVFGLSEVIFSHGPQTWVLPHRVHPIQPFSTNARKGQVVCTEALSSIISSELRFTGPNRPRQSCGKKFTHP